MLKRQSAYRRRGPSVSKVLTPAIFAVVGLFAFPDLADRADIAALLANQSNPSASWRNYMVSSAAGSIHSEEFIFADPEITGSIPSGRGLVMPDGRKVAFSQLEKPVPTTPDEARVTRHLKKGRILAAEKALPPKDFSAGSILDRRADLLDPNLLESTRTAFVKKRLSGDEMEIAMSFHRARPAAANYGVPREIASLVTNDKADSLATAYADPEPDYAKVSPFASILREPQTKRFVPEIDGPSHNWATNILPASVFTGPEQKCLAEAIYFEAATEPLKGQAAVAQVILNRVRNPTFPKSICGVVFQNEDWRNRCQFSFACDRKPDRVTSMRHWRTAKEIALAVTAGKIYLPEVSDSTHYHATYVNPNWARTMKRVGKIGLHIFYRTYNGGWT